MDYVPTVFDVCFVDCFVRSKSSRTTLKRLSLMAKPSNLACGTVQVLFFHPSFSAFRFFSFDFHSSLILWFANSLLGDESYSRLRPLSYLDADLFFICFSLVSKTSLENIEKLWLPELTKEMKGKVPPLVLVGLKHDLALKPENKDKGFFTFFFPIQKLFLFKFFSLLFLSLCPSSFPSLSSSSSSFSP